MNESDIEQFLQEHVIGRIGYTNGHLPYVIPMSYAYDGEFVYCHTREGLKVTWMREYPEVCFEVDILGNMGNWQSVIARGRYEELTDPVLRASALRKLHGRRVPFIPTETGRVSPDWPFVPEAVNDIPGVVFRIRLTEKSGRFENQSIPGQNAAASSYI